ncbi:uncharacterized protein LOC34619640 [Cyclospora cayetanensis]|uniref:Uncharacterized protein LOC34619640 n=1 Tax=Cyclospora cayetanensis TaxID=88456 RepID=A0A6P6RU88_9EIME|nr:uncharacterized protein LOC34619640 [Cyclospora cayetanensis]
MESSRDSAVKHGWGTRLYTTLSADRSCTPKHPEGDEEQPPQQESRQGSRGRSPSLRRVGDIFRKIMGPSSSPQKAASVSACPHESHPSTAAATVPSFPLAHASEHAGEERAARPQGRSRSVEQFLRRLLSSSAAVKAHRRQESANASSAAFESSNMNRGDRQREQCQKVKQATPRGRSQQRWGLGGKPTGCVDSGVQARPTTKNAAVPENRGGACNDRAGRGQLSASALPHQSLGPKPTSNHSNRHQECTGDEAPVFQQHSARRKGSTCMPVALESESFAFAGASGKPEDKACGRSSSNRRKGRSGRISRARRHSSVETPRQSAISEEEPSFGGGSSDGLRADENKDFGLGAAASTDASASNTGSSPKRGPSTEEVMVVERITTQITTITTITAQPEAGVNRVVRSSAECTVDELQQHWSFGSSSSSKACTTTCPESVDISEQIVPKVEELDYTEAETDKLEQQHDKQPEVSLPESPTISTIAHETSTLASPQVDKREIEQPPQVSHEQQDQQKESSPTTDYVGDFSALQQKNADSASIPIPLDAPDQRPMPPTLQQLMQPPHPNVPCMQQHMLQGDAPAQCVGPCVEGNSVYSFVAPSLLPSFLPVTQPPQVDGSSQPFLFPTEFLIQQQHASQFPFGIEEEMRHQQETQQLLMSTEVLQQQLQHQQQLLLYQQQLLETQKHQLWQQQQQLKAPRVKPFSYNVSAVPAGVFAGPPDPLLRTMRPTVSRIAASAAPQDDTAPEGETPLASGAAATRDQLQQPSGSQQMAPRVAGRNGNSRPPKRVSWAGSESAAEPRDLLSGFAHRLPLRHEEEQQDKAEEAWLSPATESTTGTPRTEAGFSPCMSQPSLYPTLGNDYV